jgi:hypothetical protein
MPTSWSTATRHSPSSGNYYDNGGFTAAGQVAYTYDGGNTYLLINTDHVFVDANGNARRRGHP